MKKNILIGVMLSGALFVGCGEKPKEEQKVVETSQATTTEVVEEKPQTVVAAEPKAFDGVATYSSKCSSCHGAKGEGKSIFPKLAGQTQKELVEKLQGYKNGTFGNDKKAMMIPNVTNLSDEEINQIAEVVSKF